MTDDKKKIAVMVDGKPLSTPGKRSFCVPSKDLADAIAKEHLSSVIRHPSSLKPLTALAATAIDRIEGQEAAIIDALLVYVDTDTLSYRSSPSPGRGEGRGEGDSAVSALAPSLTFPPAGGGEKDLAALQREQWDPVLAWAEKRFRAAWNVTEGIMPVDQSPELHQAIRNYLKEQGAMRLSAVCVLAGAFSSLVLALAVLERHLDALSAFDISRLEEESQAEAWGRDEEAEKRAARLREEVAAVKRFLGLLTGA